MEALDDLMTLREVSQRLGIVEGTLRVWRFRKMGPPSFKIGTTVVYRREDVEEWEKRRREEKSA